MCRHKTMFYLSKSIVLQKYHQCGEDVFMSVCDTDYDIVAEVDAATAVDIMIRDNYNQTYLAILWVLEGFLFEAGLEGGLGVCSVDITAVGMVSQLPLYTCLSKVCFFCAACAWATIA